MEQNEQVGVLSKVDYSECATPIVAVVKRDSTVRICCDFKATLNPVLQVDQYPLPRIKDIFSRCQTFNNTDLKQVYLQMTVKEDCRKYLTNNTRYNRGGFQYGEEFSCI